ncbi:MAG: DNA polymerase III subunit chi [Methylophilus sp.]
MTRVSFYTNVDHKSALVSHLVLKALNQKRQVTIFTQEVDASRMSDQLWMHDQSSYMANVLANDTLASATPVVIDWQTSTIFQDDILINLQESQPTFFSRFRQLIEIVGLDAHDKATARVRYSFYRDRGYEIKHVDMLKQSI